MKITVNYWAQVKKAAGLGSEEVNLESSCAPRELVLELARRHGEPLRSFLLGDDGQPRSNLLLIVGDRQVNWDDQAVLRDGDTLTIMPPISGGAPPMDSPRKGDGTL